jgi:hypothetical protein
MMSDFFMKKRFPLHAPKRKSALEALKPIRHPHP